MKGKIVSLEWIPGFNIKSSKGHNKSDIKKAIQNADFVKNNGFGNYTVIKYSKYLAKITYDNGTNCIYEVKDEIKNLFQVDRLTKKVRQNIEKLLPFTVDVSEDGIKLDFLKHQKVGVEYK